MANSDLRIKELCKERGITQAKLAQRIATALNVEIVDLFAAGQIKCPYCGQSIKLTPEIV